MKIVDVHLYLQFMYSERTYGPQIPLNPITGGPFGAGVPTSLLIIQGYIVYILYLQIYLSIIREFV